jgi:hypothetical protein
MVLVLGAIIAACLPAIIMGVVFARRRISALSLLGLPLGILGFGICTYIWRDSRLTGPWAGKTVALDALIFELALAAFSACAFAGYFIERYILFRQSRSVTIIPPDA